MDTLPGDATISLSFLHFLLLGGSTRKGKNLLHLEQILSFKSRPVFGMVLSPREANGKSQKLPPFKTNHKAWLCT